MTVSRILEFTPSQEEAVVARVLVLVHQTVDEHFPAAEGPSRQFTKTVFSEDGEATAIGRPPMAPNETDPAGQPAAFGSEESTSPGGHPIETSSGAATQAGASVPPPPPAAIRAQQEAFSAPREPLETSTENASHLTSKPQQPPPPPRPVPHASRSRGHALSSHAAARTGQEYSGFETQSKLPAASTPDWQLRITMALLIAGLVLLAYSLLA